MATSLPKAARHHHRGEKMTSLQLPEKESLQDANAKLRAALQRERNSLKQLRREIGVQLKQVQDEEQRKTALVVKDLKSRCHFEKMKELEFQRDNLNKKFDNEYMKLIKMKDAEHKKLETDVRKLQAELQQATASLLSTSGLSVTARDTFVLERAKLTKENQELQAAKKSLEAEVNTFRDQEKRTCYDIKKLKEDHSAEIARMNKETEIEIRKLLDELKVKERQVLQGGVSGVTSTEHFLRNTKSTVDMGPPAVSDKKKCTSSLSKEDVVHVNCTGQTNMPPGAANWTPKISELSSKLKVTEEKTKTLEDEKQRLQVRLKEMERKQRPLLEKNKKFLAKNMELSSLNRSLEDRMKAIVQENEKLKSEVHRQQKSLSRHLSVDSVVRELSPDDMRKELKEHQRKQVESEKTIAALKLACAEKDRRIELILHRKRKQRASKAQNKAAGIKETYFGYEEADCNSVADDSEMSLSICSSTDMLDDEEVFEEFTREEFEANYQRLVKEHLELERSFAVLNASSQGTGVVDSQRETKLRSQLQSDLADAQAKIKDLEKLIQNQGQDTGWIEEKAKLNQTIRALKEKIVSKDNQERTQEFQLEELQEQNEVLEFRTLELEEQCEKLSEELGQTVTFSGNSSLSDTGLLQMYAEERGGMEISLGDLKENIMQLKEEHGPRLSVEEKVCLVQYIALVQSSSGKLREFTATVAALRSRIKQLEEEKAQILSREEGIERDLVLEYETTRNKLLEQELKNHQFASDIESLTQSDAVHSYKESHFEKLEVRYQEEISELKRRLNSASEGRDYENEVFLDKLSQLRNAEKKLCELSQENETLKCQISELQRECVDLHEQLTLQQDTLSLTESDKDTVTHSGPYLQEKMTEKSPAAPPTTIMEVEKVSENENSKDTCDTLRGGNNILTEQISSLENSLSHLKSVNVELVSENTELHTLAETLKASEDKLTSDNVQLRHVLQDLSDSSRQIEDELEARQNELDSLKSVLHGKNEDILTLHNELEDKENEIKRLHDKHQKVEFAQQRSVGTLQKQLNKLKLENKGQKEQIVDLRTSVDAQNSDTCPPTDKDSMVVSIATQTECDTMTTSNKQVLSSDMDTQTSLGAQNNSELYPTDKDKDTQTSLDNMDNVTDDCAKLKELESELENLRTIINEKNKYNLNGSHSQDRTQEYETEIRTLKQEINEKEELIFESMGTVTMLQKKLNEYEVYKRTSKEEYLKEIGILQDTLGDFKQQNTELKQRLKEQEGDLNNLYDELEDKTESLEKLETAMKDKKEVLVRPQDIDGDIGVLLCDKDRKIEELEQKVINLEHSDQEAAKKILELLEAKGRLSSRLRQLECEAEGNGDSEELRFQVEQLAKAKVKLQVKVQELQDLLDEELSHSAILEKQLSVLESSHQSLEKQVVTLKVQSTDPASSSSSPEGQKIIVRTTTSKSSENSNSIAMEIDSKPSMENLDISIQSEDRSFNEAVTRNQIQELEQSMEDVDKSFNEVVLKNRVTELEHRLEVVGEEARHAQSELLTLEEDSSKRIKSLEEQIDSMEENKGRLSETVSDLGEIEKDLRKKVEIYDSSSKSTDDVVNSDEKNPNKVFNDHQQLQKLASSEQNLRDKVEQMSVNETLLRERLSEVEDKLKKYEKEITPESVRLSSTDSVFGPTVSQSDVDVDIIDSESQATTGAQCEEEIKGAVIVLHDSENVPSETSSLDDLSERVYHLESAKTQLENEFERLQEENNELVQQVQAVGESGQNETEKLKEQLEVFKTAEGKLMEQVGYLEDENETLKKQIERLSEKVADSQGGSEELEVKLSHMRKREKGLLQVIDTLKEKLDQSANEDNREIMQEEAEKQEIVQLREKVDILLDSEEKLMDKLQEKDEAEASLRRGIEEYRLALHQSETEKEQQGERVRKGMEEFEQMEEKYTQEKQEAEASHKKQIEEYEEILNVYELEKVKKNEVEESLRKTIEEFKQTVHQYELGKVEVCEKLKRLEILEEMQEGNNKLQQIANRRIAELEASEEDLTFRVKHLEGLLEDSGQDVVKKVKQLDEEEEGEEDGGQRVRYLQRELAELERVVEDYEQQIRDGKQEQEDTRVKLHLAEQREESLGVKVKDLQQSNKELLCALQSMQEQVVVIQGQSLQQQQVLVNGHGGDKDSEEVSEEPLLSASELQYVVPEVITPVSSHVTLRSVLQLGTESDTLHVRNQDTNGGGGGDHKPPTPPVDIATLEKMTQEEIFTKIQHLQKMDGFHRIKIEEMRENLEQFRKAVEVIAVAMEADAEAPMLKMKIKTRDGDFEGRMNEMVKTEVALKLRVLELEKKEGTLSKRLGDAEEALKMQQSEFNTELDELEHRLNKARKSEARLRNQLDYGGPDQESDAVVRIQELEETLIDLESSENRLKRQVEELRARELELRCQLEDAEVGRDLSFCGSVGPLTSSLRRSEDKDKYWDLVDQVRGLEASEKELKGRVEELRKEDADQLLRRITTLERSEKGLKLKLDLIEAQEASFLETVDLSMLDSPQEILKQRIRDLEQMERHLRLQIGELEKDREELHEIARRDKNVIHELNVQARELQLTEKNLKTQINRYDLEDSKMYSKLDELSDENTELKEQLEKLQTRERSLNAQLQRAQYQGTEWQLALENTKEDMQIAEGKLKKKQQDLEQDRKKLRDKSDDCLERISELEATETSLRQKLRHLENNEKQLKSRITELEQEGSNTGQRTSQLEGLNEILSEKVHKLEEEKSSLMYEVSDVQYNKEEKDHENERLVAQLKSLKSRLEENEARKSAMQERIDEFASKEIKMHAKLQDLERCDKEWRDRIQFLEHNEHKLRQRIRELEASVSTAENVKNLSGDYENEIDQLKNVAEFHRQESTKLESDKNLLQRKLQHYEYAKANDEMAMITVTELSELRTQVALLEATERELERLEDQETSLKKAVEELRKGKDACGHEFELKELKEKAELYNKTLKEKEGTQRALTSTKKAHELLKEKYEDTRQQLVSLQTQVKTGCIAGTQTSSKAVQVRLVEEYTLKHLSSEFKNALKNLGARHPQAYEDFVHLLQPTGRNVSHARVTTDPMTLTKQLAGSLQTGAGRLHQVERNRPSRRRAGSRGREEIQADITSSERQLWKAVEGRRSQEVSDEETDHPHWTQVEKNMSDTEEMTVTMNFDLEHEGYGSESGGLRKARSTESVQSVGSQNSLPPPLPNMGPPSVRRSQSPGNESYYLPSADEASEIIDEDDFHPKRKMSGLRAKSVDRDSDFSEITVPLTQSKTKAARSLDSIPDDSGYQETDNKILKDRIAHLEAEVKKKDDEMKDLSSKVKTTDNDSNKEDEIKQLRTKLQNKERELETQQKVNRDTRVEMGTKDREVQMLNMKLELLEKTHKKQPAGVDTSPYRVALKPVTPASSTPVFSSRGDTSRGAEVEGSSLVDKREKELRAKSNEVDRLVQELRKWQEDCRNAKEDLVKAKGDLERSESQLCIYKNSQEKYEEMMEKFNDLNLKYEEVVQKQKPLEQASKDKQTLEEVVEKLNRQLNDLEGIDLERKNLESKVKALEKEVKQKAQLEGELSKENVQLKHLVESLQRDNNHYRELETEYMAIRRQYKTMEEIKTKAQMMITPLRAKVLRLAQKCKTRNQLIARLVHELRKYEEGTPVLREADEIQRQEEDQDYNRPISPLSSNMLEDLETQVNSADFPPALSTTKKARAANHTLSFSRDTVTSDPLTLDSDSDELLDPKLANGLHLLNNNSNGPIKKNTTGSGIQYSTQSILYHSRPIRVETTQPGAKTDANVNTLKLLNPPQISYTPVTLLNSGQTAINTNYNKQQNSLPATTVQSEKKPPRVMTTFGMLRAVKDYDPHRFSQSGHPKLELPLKEGDLIKQLGPVDDKGYIEAEHEGHIGLVPAVYLTDTTHPDTRRRLPTVPQGEGPINSSPEQILLMHEQLAASHISQHAPSGGVQHTHNQTSQETHTAAATSRKPQRSHSLTLTHPAFAVRKPPIHPAALTPQPHPYPPPRSRPSSQPAFLHPASRNASPSLSMHNNTAPAASFFSLPTPVVEAAHRTPTPGHSRPASTPPSAMQPASASRFKVQRIVGQDGLLLSWEPPSFDELGRSNGVVVKGYKITVDQKTTQHIPSPFMSKALLERLDLTQTHTFTLVTLGDTSQSSVATHTSFTDLLSEHHRDGDSRSLAETSIDGSTSSGERRVFMAVYDFNAKDLSPHKNAREELSFKTGDVVICYGKPREDGYYFGKVHGKKGLVPASFVEEVAVFGSKSKRSHSSGSCTLSPRYPPSSSSSQSVERTQRAS